MKTSTFTVTMAMLALGALALPTKGHDAADVNKALRNIGGRGEADEAWNAIGLDERGEIDEAWNAITLDERGETDEAWNAIGLDERGVN
ncbi:hypothetical protein F4776DRAFT_603602 [Hypoxylon sp. NC0597]|nr:hypothetical protein F4776DRAFT_603602 [Hypoxylon sp. NC0597]